MSEERSQGAMILAWWGANIGDRERGRARALAATLRRADTLEALMQPEVQDLARQLGLGSGQAEGLAGLVRVLAHVRTHGGGTLAQRAGAGSEPPVSALRFQRLMRSRDDELTRALIRALPMVGRQCNVAALGQDLLHWNEQTRIRWSFHYFGASAPQEQEGQTA